MTSDVLVWVDLETSGLDPHIDEVLEVGIAVTSLELLVLAEHSEVVRTSDAMIRNMHPSAAAMHQKNGLADEVRRSFTTLRGAEDNLLDFVRRYADPNTVPMCGSSVHFDRAFLRESMPTLHDWFFYRSIDVSSIKELVKRWYGDQVWSGAPKPDKQHRALPDIHDSLNELRFYRERVFVPFEELAA